MSKHKPDVIADDLPSGPMPPERNPDFTPLRSGEPWISPGIEDVLPLSAVNVDRVVLAERTEAGRVIGEEMIYVSPVPDWVLAAPVGATFTCESAGWRYLGVPVEIADDTVRFRISRAASKERIEMAVESVPGVVPDDHAMDSIVDQHLAPLRAAVTAAEPRWHEIATEGLPATEGDYFTWDDTSVEQLALVTADGRAYWTDPFGVDSGMEYEVRNAARITHWHPVVKPAPPTKEPR